MKRFSVITMGLLIIGFTFFGCSQRRLVKQTRGGHPF